MKVNWKIPKESDWVLTLNNISRHKLYSLLNVPSICISACFRCNSVSAWMRSPRPSTSVKSNFPAWNARFVNSPGSAGAKFFILESADKTEAMTAGPPWIWNSHESSPVKLLGPGKMWLTYLKIFRILLNFPSILVSFRFTWKPKY